MQLELKPLRELIAIVHTLHNGALYLAGAYPWNPDTLGVIYVGANTVRKGTRLEDIYPTFLEQYELTFVIESAALYSVVWNAKNQKPAATISEIVAAFNHYYKYDAFMTIE